jgi:hypothetical protein
MKQELDRVKNDVETMQRAMGLPPSSGREWIPWMKRDSWFSLWWCLPGFVLIVAALLPAKSVLGLAGLYSRQAKGKDGRPEGMVQEWKRMYGKSAEGRCAMALAVPLVLYFVWGTHYHVGPMAFWTGLFILLGSIMLMAALAARAWVLLGYAIPFLAYGLCMPLAHGSHKAFGVLFGMMFIAVGLSFSIIQICQIRQIERQNESK